MSIAPAPSSVARIVDARESDPRAHRRYPISLSIHYKLLNSGGVERRGSGQTLNVSTGGTCFECLDPLPNQGAIELVMNWPFLLEGTCPLRLVMRGRIVRVDGRRIAVQVHRHEFRTAGIRASHPPSR